MADDDDDEGGSKIVPADPPGGDNANFPASSTPAAPSQGYAVTQKWKQLSMGGAPVQTGIKGQ